MSWATTRPLHADAQHIHPYNDHGLIYVTTADLRLSHALMGLTLLMLTVGLAVHFLGWRAYGAAFHAKSPRSPPPQK